MNRAAIYAPGPRAEVLRDLIEKVRVRALDDGFEIELVGETANMVDLANASDSNRKAAPEEAAVPEPYRSSVKVVAGARCQPFRIPVSAFVPIPG